VSAFINATSDPRRSRMEIRMGMAVGATAGASIGGAGPVPVKDGFIIDPRVVDKRVAELEHGAMTKVDAIVLHQTDSSRLNLDHARQDGIGAHFYIDKDGTIYQTARLDQTVYSVGKIRSRCDDTRTCSPAEKKPIDAIMGGKASYGAKVSQLSRHESAKPYPDRYPTNGDSIAIEVVGKYDPATKLFERPTEKQTESLKWLSAELAQRYGLDLGKDVYRHSDISYKQPDEAKSLVFR
jgi:N-acetyl-anhydromuramyl-L-alanine amidase AmpD